MLVAGVEYDYVTRTSQNQGVLQTTGFVNKENINPAGNWSLGLLQMDFFYREKPWYAGQFVRKITPKIEIKKRSGILFLSTLLNKQKQNLLPVLVRNVDEVFKNTKISLPVKNSPPSEGLGEELDFAFMENFISQLEAFRLSQLEAYLLVTGLKDYTLTTDEKQVLADFESGKVQWEEMKISDLFQKVKVTSLKYKTNDLPSQPKDKFVLPALTAGIQNQGLNNYVPKDGATILKNVISISANGANTGATFYQSKEFTVLQDAYAIDWKLKEKELTDNQYLFFVGIISKAIYGNYEWINKAG